MKSSLMNLVEGSMTQLSHQARGQSNRHSQPTGHVRDHPDLILLPACGKKEREDGLRRARRRKQGTKHAVKMIIFGAARLTRMVLLTTVDLVTNGIRCRRTDMRARKLAGKPRGIIAIWTHQTKKNTKEKDMRDLRKSGQTTERQKERSQRRNGWMG